MSTTTARSDGLPIVPERFDADTWEGYDPRAAAALAALGEAAGIRTDADSIYLAKALDFTSARSMRRRRVPLSGARLVPVVYEVPEHIETISYNLYDTVGMAKVISNYSDDLPRADVVADEVSVKVRTVGASYAYTVDELEKTLATRSGLDARRADAARAADAEENNRIMIQGEPRFGMPGIVSHPNIALVVAPSGTFSAAATTGDQIADAFHAHYNAVRAQSNGLHTPRVYGAPARPMAAMRTKRMSGAAQTPVLTHLREIYPDLEFVEAFELAGIGPGGTDVAFMGTNDPDDYRFEGVQRFRELGVQARNLELVVPCKSRTAGVVVNHALAAAIMGGI